MVRIQEVGVGAAAPWRMVVSPGRAVVQHAGFKGARVVGLQSF